MVLNREVAIYCFSYEGDVWFSSGRYTVFLWLCSRFLPLFSAGGSFIRMQLSVLFPCFYYAGSSWICSLVYFTIFGKKKFSIFIFCNIFPFLSFKNFDYTHFRPFHHIPYFLIFSRITNVFSHASGWRFSTNLFSSLSKLLSHQSLFLILLLFFNFRLFIWFLSCISLIRYSNCTSF